MWLPYHQARVALTLGALVSLLTGAVACGQDSQDDREPEPAELPAVPIDGPWLEYEVLPPSEADSELLLSSPYRYPTQSCRPTSELAELPESAQVSTDERGQEQLCVWNSPTAAAPEGLHFNEVGACEQVFTQAPSWFVPPARVYASPLTLLEDPEFSSELEWAREQVNSSGCACCHSSAIGSGHSSGWDAGAPAVWTDTITNARLYLLSGMIEAHREFGAFAPEENHGASRADVMIPSSDPQRLRAFFLSEFERRGGSEADRDAAQAQMDALFSRKTAAPRDCIDPFEGLIEGAFVWNGDKAARQLYIQELGSETPGFPPNLDRPEGTVWALRVAHDQAPFDSGELRLGELPERAVQLIPADGSAPRFESGRRYRLFVTPDVMLLNLANCHFTAP